MQDGVGARASWNKLLHQKRFPTCTVISVVTTAVVEAVVILFSGPAGGLAAVGAMVITYFMIFGGCIVNIVVGYIAHRRREFWGARIAVLGMATWFSTMAALPIKVA
jgi:hypothetical protein